jgi:hypothetical protein
MLSYGGLGLMWLASRFGKGCREAKSIVGDLPGGQAKHFAQAERIEKRAVFSATSLGPRSKDRRLANG